MSVSKKLIAEGEPLWNAFCSHPFLTGIGDGTLDQKKFQFYMIQDYLYLLDYARLFALGVEGGAAGGYALLCRVRRADPERRDGHAPRLYGAAGHRDRGRGAH